MPVCCDIEDKLPEVRTHPDPLRTWKEIWDNMEQFMDWYYQNRKNNKPQDWVNKNLFQLKVPRYVDPDGNRKSESDKAEWPEEKSHSSFSL